MNSTILITVCLTLSAVTVIFLFVAMFIKLRSSVKKDRYLSDLQCIDQKIDTLDDEFRERVNTFLSDLDHKLYELELKIGRDYDGLRFDLKGLRKTIDSRCDKLEHKFLKESSMEQ